jgi:hypothetical protein
MYEEYLQEVPDITKDGSDLCKIAIQMAAIQRHKIERFKGKKICLTTLLNFFGATLQCVGRI